MMLLKLRVLKATFEVSRLFIAAGISLMCMHYR